MNDELVEMFEWNYWANEKYREHLKTIDFDKMKIDTPYGVLLDRIVHIFASFRMWHQRMEGESPSTVLQGKDFDDWNKLLATWREYDQLLIDYVKTISAEKISERITYTSLDKSVYTRTRRHILLHLTAHPNYHRGHISSIFKLQGYPPFPSTDMVVYYLDKGIDTRSIPE